VCTPSDAMGVTQETPLSIAMMATTHQQQLHDFQCHSRSRMTAETSTMSITPRQTTRNKWRLVGWTAVAALARLHCAVLILKSIGGAASSRTANETNMAEYENVLQKLEFLHDQSGQRRIETDQTTIYFDTDQCKEDLFAADAENDGQLSSKEYVDLINIRSDNYFSWVENLVDFQPSALLFVSLFNLAACDESVDGSSCKDEEATIDITAAADDTKNNQILRLCQRIDMTLLKVMTEAPSPSPTAAPTVSPAPTPVPTQTPTRSPTVAPSPSPPTSSPVTEVTIPPAPSPVAPSSPPTPSPTATPVVAPSAAPTTPPSDTSPTGGGDFSGELDLRIAFGVRNEAGYTASSIKAGIPEENTMLVDIQEGLRVLVLSVLVETDFSNSSQSRMLRQQAARRRLVVGLKVVKVDQVTDIGKFVPVLCFFFSRPNALYTIGLFTKTHLFYYFLIDRMQG
jgi:hypothetical protein